jgi:hypothetical protein
LFLDCDTVIVNWHFDENNKSKEWSNSKSNYVLYETGRRYDPNRQYTLVDRKNIGVQIPGRPEMMLPNESYLTYFPKGDEKMTNKDGQVFLVGLTYSDVALMMTQFKGAVNRFFQRR